MKRKLNLIIMFMLNAAILSLASTAFAKTGTATTLCSKKVKQAALKAINKTEKHTPGGEDILQFIWKKGNERMHGKAEFLDLYTPYSLVGFQSKARLPFVMNCKYNILKSAPVITGNSSQPKVSLFEVYYYKSNKHAEGLIDSSVDFNTKGINTSNSTEMTLAPSSDYKFSKGVATIVRPVQFCLKKNGKWLRNGRNTSWVRLKTPLFFAKSSITEKLLFTIANLKSYKIKLTKFESDWQPGGNVRVKLTVQDADGETFPVLTAKAAISDGKWSQKLEPEFDLSRMPTGYLRGRLPEGYVPAELGFYGIISVLKGTNPLKEEHREISSIFVKNTGLITATQINKAIAPKKLPRNKDGLVLETRALYSDDNILRSRKTIDNLIRKAEKAGLNTIIQCVYHLDKIYVKSDINPNLFSRIEKNLDPLAYMIDKAHAKNLEVHVWFCVNTGNKKFRDWFQSKYNVDIGVVSVDKKQNSKVIAKYAVDLQRKEYRDYITSLMLEAVKNYDIDGLHLDYIRTKTTSYSPKNQYNFKKRFGKEMSEATTEDWTTWSSEPVSEIVYNSNKGLKTQKKNAVLSASVASDSFTTAGRFQGQNSDQWAEKTGSIICPMDYTAQTVLFLMNERGFLKALGKNRDCLISGIGMYDKIQNYCPKNDMITGVKIRDLKLLKEQITVSRNLGIHGYNLFNSDRLTDEVADFLGKEVNQEKAVPYFRKEKQ